ncbi:RP9 protein, partial [Atractosteus spatula]|nr:RP9 protein [Atractosteus spatula]
MPLGREVKVMQCWRCKRYGHRTGDKECPFFIKGNQKLEQFRVAHEDPMYDLIRENRRHEKEMSLDHHCCRAPHPPPPSLLTPVTSVSRIQQLQQLLEDTTSDSESSSSTSSHSDGGKKKKKKGDRKKKKEKKKKKRKRKHKSARLSNGSGSD